MLHYRWYYEWEDGRVEELESGSGQRLRRGEWKSGLIENDVARYDDAFGGEVHATIALVVRGVTEKHTRAGPGCKFMWHGGGGIRIA